MHYLSPLTTYTVELLALYLDRNNAALSRLLKQYGWNGRPILHAMDSQFLMPSVCIPWPSVFQSYLVVFQKKIISCDWCLGSISDPTWKTH